MSVSSHQPFCLLYVSTHHFFYSQPNPVWLLPPLQHPHPLGCTFSRNFLASWVFCVVLSTVCKIHSLPHLIQPSFLWLPGCHTLLGSNSASFISVSCVSSCSTHRAYTDLFSCNLTSALLPLWFSPLPITSSTPMALITEWLPDLRL